MARGNQRDLARAKNLKKQGNDKKKPEGKVVDRKERDAEAMRQKQKLAEEKKQATAAEGAAGSSKTK